MGSCEVMLYHELQESKLCALHCVNTVLQGPFFTEIDLAAIAAYLDEQEQQIGCSSRHCNSQNASLDGNFSIQVLQRALEECDLRLIPLKSPQVIQAQKHPELENAFICHLGDHWHCIRKVEGEWYNFDSRFPAPEHLTVFYLTAYLDTLKSSRRSIFVVRGNFPENSSTPRSECRNKFGKWISPDDALRITSACEQSRDNHGNFSNEEGDDELMEAAIAANLEETCSSTSWLPGTLKFGGPASSSQRNTSQNPIPRNSSYFEISQVAAAIVTRLANAVLFPRRNI